MSTEPQDRQKPALRNVQIFKVGLLFCCAAVGSDLIVWYLGKKEYLAFLDIFTTYVITALLHLSGLQAVMESNTIYLANSTWIVTTECTAIFIMLIFASFILVYPSPLRAKGIALITGIPVIFCANIARLFMMAWVDKLSPQYTEYFHQYIWQIVFIVMIVFMWLVWIQRVVASETKISVPS